MGTRPPGPSPSNRHKLVHTPARPMRTNHNAHNTHFTPNTLTADSFAPIHHPPLIDSLLIPPCYPVTQPPSVVERCQQPVAQTCVVDTCTCKASVA